MVDQDDGTAAESRPPTLNDLLTLCRELNELKAKYIVILDPTEFAPFSLLLLPVPQRAISMP